MGILYKVNLHIQLIFNTLISVKIEINIRINKETNTLSETKK